MKFNVIKKGIALAAIMTAVTSCNKFGDVNVDPNNPSTVPASYIIVSAEKGIMDATWDEFNNGRFGLVYSQYWAQKQYSDESQYLVRTETVRGFWRQLYAGTTYTTYTSGGLQDLQEIIRLNTEKNVGAVSDNQIAVARILKAWTFHMMTDIWGSIPYSQALKGADERTPAYDDQRTIYLDLLTQLDEAIAQIDVTADAFGSNDNIYASDMTAWKKFAYSLKMRIAMRMSDREPALAQSTIEDAYTKGFQSNADNAYFRYLDGAPNNNPLNQDRIDRGDADFAVSNTLVDYMNTTSDPRLPFYADEAVDGGYHGMIYGLDPSSAAAVPGTSVSTPSGAGVVRDGGSFRSTDVLASTAPAIFMDYAEVCFILAEAAERGWSVGGSAETWYNAGISASMDYWGASASDVATYLARTDVAYTSASGTWKQKIGVQKWLALYMQGVQGWTEWRRLDFVLFNDPETFQDGTAIPVRWPYPSDEATVNGANYNAAVSAQGADEQSTKLWWDMN